MTHNRLRCGTTLAALLLSTSAFADVTPEQVWANWKTVGAAYGQVMTAASEQRSGDTLTVSGIAINSSFDGGSVSGTIDEIAFREVGDGTVEITMSDAYPLTLITEGPDAGDVTVNILVKQPGLKVIAGGTEAETRYDFTAPSVAVSVADITAEAKPVDLTLAIGLTNLTGNYIVGQGTPMVLASTFAADSTTFDMAFADPENGGNAKFSVAMAMLAATSSGNLLNAETMEDFGAALAAGFATDGSMSYGATTYAMDVVEDTETMAAKGALGGGTFTFGLDKDRMQYGGTSTDVTMNVSSSAMPFPELAVTYADAAFNFLMPMAKSETPGAFALLTRLTGMTVSDAAWDMFDAGKVLPRDPATVVLDAKGMANWLVDITDPVATAAMGDAMPIALSSLDITEVRVQAAGAEVTGNGAFTFDNTDTTTFDGMPAPTGVMDFRLVGANGLIDKLVAMGLLPDDQAMGARMMMGMFARPGDGEDVLTSQIEFKDKGFYANGQRLQ